MESNFRIPIVTCAQATITSCDGDLPLKVLFDEVNLMGYDKHNSWAHSLKVVGCEESNYAIYILQPAHIELGHMALRRMMKVAQDTDATMVYCDHLNRMPNGSLVKHPITHKVLAFSRHSDKINIEINPQYIRRFPDEDFVLACQSAFLFQKSR